MSLDLDIRTLTMVLAMTMGTAALVLGLLYRQHPGLAGPRAWAIGMGLIAVGFVLMFARGIIPDVHSIVVANGAIILGYAALYVGMGQFTGRPVRWGIPVLIVGATWVLFFVLYESDRYLAVRIVIGSIGASGFSLMIAAVLFRDSPPGLTARRATAAIMTVHAVVNLGRGGWAVVDPPTGSLMQAGVSTTIVYAWSIIGIFAFTALTVVMTTERLRDALKTRMRDLDAARAVAEVALDQERKAMREQRNLLAMISHEFRTPLGIVSAATDVIGCNLAADDRESAEELDRIRRTVRRLVHLVDRCLADEWLETASGTRHLTGMDLVALLRRVANEFDVPLTVDTDAPIVVEADAFLLPIAVSNLIDNARKYGAARSAPRLRCSLRPDGVHIEVEDDGPGINAVDLPNIFEKFYRAPGASRQPGAGLGLYFVRRIAELHGGRVEVDTSHGHGGRFRLVLPRRPVAIL